MSNMQVHQMSTATLNQLAQTETRKGLNEDKKGASETAKGAFRRQIEAKTNAIEKQKQESDSRFEANKSRTSGGLLGGLIGGILGIAVVVVGIIFCPPLVAVGAALIGFGPMIGGAFGESAAEDDDEAAKNYGDQAHHYELEVTQAEKERGDADSQVQEINQRLRQSLEDARALNKRN